MGVKSKSTVRISAESWAVGRGQSACWLQVSSADNPVLIKAPEETMKIRSVVTVVGLAISFALPTFAQQKDTADPGVVQQRDLLGVPKALDVSCSGAGRSIQQERRRRGGRVFHGGRAFGGTRRDV
jgi:hypothetical protein